MKLKKWGWILGSGILLVSTIGIVGGVIGHFLNKKNASIIIKEEVDVKYETKEILIDTPYSSNINPLNFVSYNVVFKEIKQEKQTPDKLFKSYSIQIAKPVLEDWFINHYHPTYETEFNQFITIPEDKSIIDEKWIVNRLNEFNSWKTNVINQYKEKKTIRLNYLQVYDALGVEENGFNKLNVLENHKTNQITLRENIINEINNVKLNKTDLISNEQLLSLLKQYDQSIQQLKLYDKDLNYINDFENKQFYKYSEIIKNNPEHEQKKQFIKENRIINTNIDLPNYEELKQNNQLNSYLQNTLKPIIKNALGLSEFNLWYATNGNNKMFTTIMIQPNVEIYDYIMVYLNFNRLSDDIIEWNKDDINYRTEDSTTFEFLNNIIPNPNRQGEEFNGIVELTNDNNILFSNNVNEEHPNTNLTSTSSASIILHRQGLEDLGAAPTKYARFLRDSENQDTSNAPINGSVKIPYKTQNHNEFNDIQSLSWDLIPNAITQFHFNNTNNLYAKYIEINTQYLFIDQSLSTQSIDTNNVIKNIPSTRSLTKIFVNNDFIFNTSIMVEDSYENFKNIIKTSTQRTMLKPFMDYLTTTNLTSNQGVLVLNEEHFQDNPILWGTEVDQYEMFLRKWFNLFKLFEQYDSQLTLSFIDNIFKEDGTLVTKFSTIKEQWETIVLKLIESQTNTNISKTPVLLKIKEMFNKTKEFLENGLLKINDSNTKQTKFDEYSAYLNTIITEMH